MHRWLPELAPVTRIPLADFGFETARLRIRPMQASDHALYCDVYTDAETMRFVGPALSPVRARSLFRKAIAMMHDDPVEWVFLVIEDKASARSLGLCGLPNFDAEASRPEIGMMLCGNARGQGYSVEALGGLVRQVFLLLPAREIRVVFSPDHVAAIRMLRQLGFTPVADSGEEPARCTWNIRRDALVLRESRHVKGDSIPGIDGQQLTLA